MRVSQLLGERYKEKPADASLISHIFLLRGGYIRQVASGIFSLLPPAQRVTRKIEEIIRQEMDRVGGQEVLFPVVLPASLWEESGRFQSVGSELLRFKDRTGQDFVLGMTHEEAAVHLARGEAKSYTKYPFMIYQIQTKFRDEPRSRGGLIRVREFTMKDAYSFHTSQEDLESYYDEVLDAYVRIYKRAGLGNVKVIKSDTGMMGGSTAHEFMYICDGGEDSIVYCESCGYAANMEVAVSTPPAPIVGEEKEIQEVHTPGIKDIESLAEFLGVLPMQTIKAAVFARKDNNKPVVVFVRGDLEVNETKVTKVVKAEIYPLTDYSESDLDFGFIGPVGLKAEGAEVIFDKSLDGLQNMVCGANKTDYHLKNVSVPRDLKDVKFVDVASVGEGHSCSFCGNPLKITRGIEVGNIFQLGDKYTKSMNMTYLDQNGRLQTPIMGCYGIGVGRLLACIIEEHHDQYGPIWPITVAPWQVHICILNNNVEEVRNTGMDLYHKLGSKFEVVVDDRNVSAGFQLADADLIGVPVRVIVSKRNLENGEVEVVTRDKSTKVNVKLEEVEAFISDLIAKMEAEINS
jgi:prolyl-tRNA synthetase